MFHVALYQPEIPPNTGNIIRLCANTGSALHLIEPLGFELDDSRLRRAGLDYREWARIRTHPHFEAFLERVQPPRVLACSTRGTVTYSEVQFERDDCLLFGPETRGLSAALMHKSAIHAVLRIPMLTYSRSVNLSNAVAVVLYEAWRQTGFQGGL